MLSLFTKRLGSFDYYKIVILAVKGQCIACGEKGSTQTYPFIERDPCGPLRNHKQTYQDAELAVKENQSVSYIIHVSSYTCNVHLNI